MSGYDADIPLDEFIKLDRYGPEARVCSRDMVMDSVVASSVDLDVVASWGNKEIGQIKDLLEREEKFEELFIQDRAGLVPGEKSTLSEKQVSQLEEMGVIEKKKRKDGPAKCVVKAFTVSKKNHTARLIVDATKNGDRQEEPPEVSLPTVDDVKRGVSEHEWIAQLDGKSWFYQFAAKGIKKYFAMRTVLGWYWLVVLAMGWSWSVWIAQTVALEIVSEARRRASLRDREEVDSSVYIDNFIAFGNKEDLQHYVDSLDAVSAECGAVLKKEEQVIKKQDEVLGMFVDLERKEVSLKAGWVAKFKEVVALYLAAPSKFKLKHTWKIVGSALWGMRVLGIPQLDHMDFKMWMAKTARDLQSGRRRWEDSTRWPDKPLADLKRLLWTVGENSPCSVVRPERALVRERLWSDASKKGGAFILQGRGVVESFKWKEREENEYIHIKEGRALLEGVKCWERMKEPGEGLTMFTDSVLVWLGMQKRKARGKTFAAILKGSLDRLEGVDWDIVWVPTEEQLADKPSRNFDKDP